jgi:TonB-linked SusC/RagA family outer membrane protein
MVIKNSILNQIKKAVMRRTILFFQIIILLLPAALHAQSITIRGTVKDVDGVLPGVTIVEKGVPTNGVITNNFGKFSLTFRGPSRVIIVKFVGDITQEINVAGKQNIDVNMATNTHGLDEVTVVGYGKTTRITNTGAVSSINAADVREIPTANVQNTLAGRLPGFFSQQSSGQPGKDASDFFIRGQSSLNANGNQPLIIVDDIEYTYDQLQQINVNEIESISILKDASSTAIYGIKGANGVLVVTTRRGKAGTPKINFRAETGLQSATVTPTFLDSYQSAVLIDQAEANDNLVSAVQKPLSFTASDLALFKDGDDPYGHPNVNWYNEIINKYSYQTNANLDVSGGNDQIKYFISGGALDQNGDLKNFPDPRGLVDNNYYFNRYDFRSNLDLKANKTLDLRLDVTTRFSDLNQPSAAGSVIGSLYDFTQETPFTAPYLNPNGTFAYAYSPFNPAHLPTLNARLASGGNANSKRTDYNVLFNATQKLNSITDGLTATARVAYASTEQYTSNDVSSSTDIPAYHYDALTSTYTLSPNGAYVFPTYSQTGSTDIYTNDVNVQLFANYDRTFSSVNHFTGLLLLNQDASNTYANNTLLFPLTTAQIGVPSKYEGISLKIGYDYAGKYLFDFNSAYNGTDRFAPGHRFGYFPAVSAGYNINKEDFFKKMLPVFSLFKVRGSYGIVGSDAAPGNQYVYTQNYLLNSSQYGFGTSQQLNNTYYEGSLGNNNVVWERQKELDLGLDMNLLHDKVTATIDYFHYIRYDQLITPAAVSDIIGVSLPAENLGRTQNNGYDGQIGYHSSIGKVQFSTSFVFSYAKNKILYEDEPQPAYPYLAQTGHSINQPFGYHFLGYYTAAQVSEVKAFEAAHGGANSYISPTTGKLVADPIAVPANGEQIEPGDLRYADLNGDGYINVNDERAIGYPNLPNTTLGLNLQASYKGLSVSVLFQGSFNYSFILTGTGIEPFQSQFQPIMEQAWTPQNANNAQFPRLTEDPTTINSPTFYPSDYWLVNAYYVRLKTLEIRYNVPSKLLPFHLTSGSIYFTAYNLITWDNYDKYQTDPEITSNTAGDAYINQRVINLGVQLGF